MHCFGYLLLALSSTLFTLNSAQNHDYTYCGLNSQANYTANSTFQANLNLLLSSISSNTNPFYNNSVGRSPDRVYGLFQCRGDYNSQACHRCARAASEAIAVNCQYYKQAVIYYDECWLHYSDINFLSTVVDDTNYSYFGRIVSDPTQLISVLNELMDLLVVQAVSNASSLFAAGETNYTTSRKLYGLVQCTQDLSADYCNRCLRLAVSQFVVYNTSGRQGARINMPSCNVRYQDSEFFQLRPIAPAPPVTTSPNTIARRENSLIELVAIIVLTIIAALLLGIIAICFRSRRKKEMEIVNDVDEVSTVESLQFNLATIIAATDNFNDANRLGEGGFGAVYKGKLSDGREIAVKRLSRNSAQGGEEFKNEVLLLVRLQHRNLVRLFGFCLEGDESLLIYEFVPNSSLDKFTFDPVKRTSLDWESRYKIIRGIARGLLYLHEDSRDRIIHRDLKASNVLLDDQMNPKISDFGMARLFVVDQTRGSTKRIVGTYGYMSPEYARHGRFSVKSDVFSFGVLILEIITGHRNSNFYESECGEDLLSYVWIVWQEGTSALELLEPTCKHRYSRNEVMRCVHMGLLCVQEDPARRPTMASVDLMLSSYSVTLPSPSAPGFFVKSRFEMVPEVNETLNEASITELCAR